MSSNQSISSRPLAAAPAISSPLQGRSTPAGERAAAAAPARDAAAVGRLMPLGKLGALGAVAAPAAPAGAFAASGVAGAGLQAAAPAAAGSGAAIGLAPSAPAAPAELLAQFQVLEQLMDGLPSVQEHLGRTLEQLARRPATPENLQLMQALVQEAESLVAQHLRGGPR